MNYLPCCKLFLLECRNSEAKTRRLGCIFSKILHWETQAVVSCSLHQVKSKGNLTLQLIYLFKGEGLHRGGDTLKQSMYMRDMGRASLGQEPQNKWSQ